MESEMEQRQYDECKSCLKNIDTIDRLTAQLDTYKQALHLVYQLGNTYRHGVNVSGVEVGEIARQALKEVE